MKLVLILEDEKFKIGIANLDDAASGISMVPNISVITSAKKLDKPNNIGAPKHIAENINITYIMTLLLIF